MAYNTVHIPNYCLPVVLLSFGVKFVTPERDRRMKVGGGSSEASVEWRHEGTSGWEL